MCDEAIVARLDWWLLLWRLQHHPSGVGWKLWAQICSYGIFLWFPNYFLPWMVLSSSLLLHGHFSLKYFQTLHSSPKRVMYGMSFVGTASHLYITLVIVASYAICYNRLCLNVHSFCKYFDQVFLLCVSFFLHFKYLFNIFFCAVCHHGNLGSGMGDFCFILCVLYSVSVNEFQWILSEKFLFKIICKSCYMTTVNLILELLSSI